MACTTAKDCSVNGTVMTCYRNPPWSDEEDFCDCSSFWGFTGERCDQFGFTNVYYTISLSALMICSAAGILFYCKVFWMYAKDRRSAPGERKQAFDMVFCTGVFMFVGFLFLFLYPLMLLPSVMNPKNFEIIEDSTLSGEKDFVAIDTYILSQSCRTIAVVCFVWGSLFISLSWLRVVSSTAHFMTVFSPSLLKNYTIFVGIAAVVYPLLSISLYAADFISAILIVCPTFMMSLVGLFYMGRQSFLVILKTVNHAATDDRYNTLIYLVDVSSRNSIYLITILNVSVVLGFYFQDHFEDYIPVGGFNWILVIKDFESFIGISGLASHSWYVYGVLKLRQGKSSRAARNAAESAVTHQSSKTGNPRFKTNTLSRGTEV